MDNKINIQGTNRDGKIDMLAAEDKKLGGRLVDVKAMHME
jgi:hypothetical protein